MSAPGRDGALRLSFIVREYPHVVPLITGEVTPDGVDLDYHRFDDWVSFTRRIHDSHSDVFEMSFSQHIQSVALGTSKVQALPIFPARHFKHSAWYINAASGIERPEDLAGRRVGLFSYRMSTSLWARGIVQHQHGVDLTSITLVTSHREEFDTPLPVTIELHEGADLEQMLVDGQIDALIHPTVPAVYGGGSGVVQRLFPDFRQAEIDYFRTTRIFPIGHIVAIKRELLAGHPWLAQSLFDAFETANRLSYERHRAHPDLSPLIWAQAYYASEQAVLGDDPLLYGLEASRPSVVAELQYMEEQGMLPRVPAIDELFAPVRERQPR